ncbi:uncharacterized protein LOC112569191 [Pomacea canaliculata]|uniref:uncharacterized protein LOC112569191 n=1 Tax=Pomacea canaliculata TaxID=400727 RepID=UPI000D73350D|nr:uncharacterized protein LOC112569191 [Pomacea canaliculata]
MDQGGLTMTESYIYYDYTNLRNAAFMNFTNPAGQVFSYENLLLYNKPNNGTLYHLDLKTRKCLVKKVSSPFIRYCIPDTAQKVADLTLGAATESLPVTVYSLKEQNATVHHFITVTQKQCIPVSQVILENSKVEEAMSFTGYGNIQLENITALCL